MRLHVLPDPKSAWEAAAFIASSLLLSHGIRRDTAALVRVGGKWILAEGARVRQLRPDADSAEGWVRAVLRGKRLGAQLLESPPPPVGRVVLLEKGAPGGLEELPVGDVTVCYGGCPYEEAETLGSPDWPPYKLAATVNIVLDRMEAGSPACPRS